MAFCVNCGQKLAEGARFCSNCGNAVSGEETASKRKTVYAGKVYKCPNCGDVLNSFSSVCPLCGCELRGVCSTDAINDFTNKLAAAASLRNKVSIIRNFPVPNTKEDIMEFLILASSNCDKSQGIDVIEAWMAKMSQCMQKAKIFVVGDDLLLIQNCYFDTMKKAKKQRAALSAKSFVKKKTKPQKNHGLNGSFLSIVTATIFKNMSLFISLIAFIQTIRMDAIGDDVSGAGFVLLGMFFLAMSALLLLRKSSTYGDFLITIAGTILIFRLSGEMCEENGAGTLLGGVIATVILIPAFIKKMMQKQ